MTLPFLTDPDLTRFCYLRLRRLKEATHDAAVVAALARELEVPDGTLSGIEKRIDELRAAAVSFWHDVAVPEILAASVFKARPHAPEAIDAFFRPVAALQDLSKPLSEWLHVSGLTPQPGGVARTGRANLIGHRGGGTIASPRTVGIEVVNDPAEIATTLADKSIDNTNAGYLACTPAVAAGFLWLNAGRSGSWDAAALQRGLQPSGRGLLLVEGDAVAQAIAPKERKPDKALLQQLAVDLQAGPRKP
ncbi:MAG: hypothetical protein ABUS79_14870 [Pseudomonadota bacterium]